MLCGSDRKRVRFEQSLPTAPAGDVLHYQYFKGADGVPSNHWHYRVVQCEACGHCFPDPIYDEKTIANSYLEQEHDNGFGLDVKLLAKTHRGYAAIAEKFLATERALHVDVGCDTGLFLREARALGFKRSVGVEPGEGSAAEARQIPDVEIQQGLFRAEDFEPASVDLLSLIHVLDHLTDTRGIVRAVKPTLRNNGIVLAVVHNIASLVARISGNAWAPLNLVHMEYFTPSTLRRLFELEGYRVLAVESTVNHFPLDHLFRFAPFLPTAIRTPLVSLARSPGIRSLVLPLRLGNIAVVAARSDAA